MQPHFVVALLLADLYRCIKFACQVSSRYLTPIFSVARLTFYWPIEVYTRPQMTKTESSIRMRTLFLPPTLVRILLVPLPSCFSFVALCLAGRKIGLHNPIISTKFTLHQSNHTNAFVNVCHSIHIHGYLCALRLPSSRLRSSLPQRPKDNGNHSVCHTYSAL